MSPTGPGVGALDLQSVALLGVGGSSTSMEKMYQGPGFANSVLTELPGLPVCSLLCD